MPKVIPEARARRAPRPVISVDREDLMMQTYWTLMRQLRERGWQIDRQKLEELDRQGDARVIGGPGRRADPENWVYKTVPRVMSPPLAD